MRKFMKIKMFAAGLAVLALMGGCSEKTQQQVEETGKAVVADVKENAAEAVQVTKEAAAGAELTASVKSALLASDKMDTTALNVDTVDKVVHLKGYVPTLEQRTLAEEIARNTVPTGVTVTNELNVGAAPDATGTPASSATVSGTPNPAAPGTITDDAHDSHDGHDHSHEGDDHNHAAPATPGAEHDHGDHSHDGEHDHNH